MGRTTVAEYLDDLETLRRRELVYGIVREPPSPFYPHQSVVTRLTVLLDRHVRAHGLGQVCVSPIDVVLDPEQDLIVQPDVVFVSNARADIIRNQIWGAPDLVVEVASRGTARYDRTDKIGWYRRYGVRECWLVLPGARRVEIVPLATRRGRRRVCRPGQPRHSHVLPELRLTASAIFE